MSDEIPRAGTFTPAITFWTRLWQMQLEQSLRIWAAWAQMLPHDSARALAEEAEHMKPAVPRTVPVKPVAASASATVTAMEPAHKTPARKIPDKAPAAAQAADAPVKAAPRTPVRTGRASQPPKPALH